MPVEDNKKKKIVVIGAGCAGLSAAWRLARNGFRVKVIERSSRPGGMSAGTVIDGNFFEHGPHVFHSNDPEIMSDIKQLMDDVLIPFDRTIKIKFAGKYFDYPLKISEIIFNLPLPTVISAVFSFLFHSIKGLFITPKIRTSETVLIRSYGRVLYEIFFKNYIEHVWGIHPSKFSPSFAQQRIPKMDILKIIKKACSFVKLKNSKNKSTDNFVENVEGELYSTKSGFGGITEKIADEIRRLGSEILLNARLKKIMVDDNNRKKEITYSCQGNELTESADIIISTIPVNNLVKMIQPSANSAVLRAADSLKYRALVFVGIVVPKKHVLPSSFMYFREHSFNRVMDLSYFGIQIKPEGQTILVAEISCGIEDEIWKNETLAKKLALEDFYREKILTKDEVTDCYVYRQKYAYPVYSLRYQDDLNELFGFLGTIEGIDSTGRQGKFAYINAHIAMRMGYDAADKVINGSANT